MAAKARLRISRVVVAATARAQNQQGGGGRYRQGSESAVVTAATARAQNQQGDGGRHAIHPAKVVRERMRPRLATARAPRDPQEAACL